MIDVARIDHWAASGSGIFHRSSTIAKTLFFLFVVASAVTAKSAYPLMAGYGLILVTAAVTGLPWTRMVPLSGYAVLFAFLYGLTLRGGLPVFALLIAKAVTPALAMVTIVVTTPYPKMFAFLSSFLPEIIAAGLFMTYRTLFILLEMMDNFGAAIRLRGGFSPGSLYKNSANLSKGIGMLLVKAVERSSRLYAVMAVRGYSGSMAQKGFDPLRREDLLPVGLGCLIFILAVIWK